jgi:catechol 2,3-dioxygenase-like lactoylglutathione lyase family enzyme
MINNMHNIGIAVADYLASADWYRELGFDLTDDYGSAGLFKAGTAVLYIFQTDASDSGRPRDLNPVHNTPGLDHMSFRVDDVDAVHQQLTDRGVEIQSPPTNQDWGSRTIAIKDPDGVVIWMLGPLRK